MVVETTMENDTLNEHGLSNGIQASQANLGELHSLLRNEVPESRQTLLETCSNLEKVAEYCSTTYLEAEDKRSAFDNTKNYTTHSLASVAYQINTLAYNLLHMLELQTNQMSEMESQLNYITQKIQFHNEKMARRKVALLTSTKNIVRKPKVLIPANNEKQARYVRKPIDFSLLDDIGHGVKISNSLNMFRNVSNSSTRMSGVQTLGPKSSMSSLSQYHHHYNTLSGSGPAPTTKPPTPPQAIRSGYGTLSRTSQNKEYRALAPPIAPPQVPKNYESNYPIGHPKNTLVRQTSGAGGYAPGNQMVPQPNPSQYMQGMAHSHYHAGSKMSNPYASGANQMIATEEIGNNLPLPPPVPVDDMLPDPPSPSTYDCRNMTASPPLPPPPPSVEAQENHHHTMMAKSTIIYGATAGRQNVPEWVPPNYIEKVIAIFDYVADKDDELTFQENSVIYVTRKNDDGWFEGVMNGVTGLFPGNYVEPCL